MKEYKLKDIVKSTLMDRGLPIHYYLYFLHYGFDAFRNAHFDTIGKVKSVRLKINDANEAELPADCVKVIKVGQMTGDRVRPFTKSGTFNNVNNRDTYQRNTLHPEQETGIFLFDNFFNDRGEPLGKVYGWGSRFPAEEYRVDREAGVIRFSNQAQFTQDQPYDWEEVATPEYDELTSIYIGDFSTDEDSFTGTNATVSGNEDNVTDDNGASLDDVMKFYGTGGSTMIASRAIADAAGLYKVTAQVLVPSGQSNIDGFYIQLGDADYSNYFSNNGTCQYLYFNTYGPTASTPIQIGGTTANDRSGLTTANDSDDDIVYVAEIQVESVLAVDDASVKQIDGGRIVFGLSNAGDNEKLYYTDDNFETMTAAHENTSATTAEMRGIVSYGNYVLVLAGEDRIYRSDDRGTTYTEDTIPAAITNGSIHVDPDGNMYVLGVTGGNGVVYKSTDFGSNWTTPVSEASSVFTDGHFFNGNDWLLLKTNAGTYTIEETSDAGTGFTTLKTVPGEGKVIEFRDRLNGIVVLDNGPILVTSDAGATWSWRSSGAPTDDYQKLFYINNYEIVAIGTEQTIVSNDIGDSWTEEVVEGYESTYNTRDGDIRGEDDGVIIKIVDDSEKTDNTAHIYRRTQGKGTNLILEYLSDGIGITSETLVHPMAHDTIKAYIHWKYLEFQARMNARLVSRFDINNAQEEYFRQNKLLRRRTNSLSLDDIIQSLRKTATQAPKY